MTDAGATIDLHRGRFTERERAVIQELTALAANRVEAEQTVEQQYRKSGEALERDRDATREAIRAKLDTELKSEQAEYEGTMKRIRAAARTEYDEAQRAHDLELERIVEKAEQNDEEARRQWNEAVWLAETVYEAGEKQPRQRFEHIENAITERQQALLALTEHARERLRKYRVRVPSTESSTRPIEPADTVEKRFEQIDGARAEAQTQLERLIRSKLGRLFKGLILPTLIVMLLIPVAVLTLWQRAWQVDEWLGINLGIAVVVLVALAILARTFARRRTLAIYLDVSESVQRGLTACDLALKLADEQRDREENEMLEQRDNDIETAREKYEPILTQIAERKQHHLARIAEKYPLLLREIEAKRDQELEETEKSHEQKVESIRAHIEQERKDIEERYATGMAKREAEYKGAWDELETTWKEGMTQCRAELDAMIEEDAALFMDWNDESWSDWSPPHSFAPSIRFGNLQLDLTQIEGGVPTDERLIVPGPDHYTLPAAIDFAGPCSLVIRTKGDGRDEGLQTIQNVMMRLLTTLPPGKVRFTIVDPVGLGRGFAGFMHLADYEELFVTSRIWTETRHIEQRLTDLTEHMETVIQKYLRNEFETIAEYNEQAGEIAEPYRFLVIADFPVNFSDTAAKRLASIASSGARCGVHTLILVDERQGIPPGVSLADLCTRAITIQYKDEAFVLEDETLKELPLTLDPPPAEDFVTRTLHEVGAAAKDATRVEVPFRVIAPKPDQLWAGECSRELSVPLGRCGATKLQRLNIGTGTAQHALIAGKTGSGKSTLLHVLITNLALWYSPDEVQFYLVDFKKGVEFKTYAEHALPHAKAIAIESDREFGLSVLQRIDAELKHRGDRFRELGVQDLAGYRALGLDEPMPRTLLIVDEFQELFVEDDKIGQDAALLMDRIVRQGRAFGLHVLLGSQTLGGAYTLARSTIGQMQVRIALQCTEADSYLILSDDNAAARLLSRPGEAIYNDAGGRIEGNSPFQIVWLPDEVRDEYLDQVTTRASKNGYRRTDPQIVFEGSIAAELRNNHLIEELLEDPKLEGNTTSPSAWLGEAIAIKGPTAAIFRRHSGSNALIVGQQDESALVSFGAALISLAAQLPPGKDGASFYVLDGSPADSPNTGFLEEVASLLPHEVNVVKWRDVEDAIQLLHDELDRRQEHEGKSPHTFLMIYGLQRFRMLRASDDFGFSMDRENEKPAPDKQFADILRDGPVHSMHSLIWCDTVANLNRTLERQGLREFETRILYQMSAADSTTLIDSPQATKVGLGRAMFYNEEDGIFEKFRPYAMPDKPWLESVRERLKKRWKK